MQIYSKLEFYINYLKVSCSRGCNWDLGFFRRSSVVAKTVCVDIEMKNYRLNLRQVIFRALDASLEWLFYLQTQARVSEDKNPYFLHGR